MAVSPWAGFGPFLSPLFAFRAHAQKDKNTLNHELRLPGGKPETLIFFNLLLFLICCLFLLLLFVQKRHDKDLWAPLNAERQPVSLVANHLTNETFRWLVESATKTYENINSLPAPVTQCAFPLEKQIWPRFLSIPIGGPNADNIQKRAFIFFRLFPRQNCGFSLTTAKRRSNFRLPT